MFSYRHALEQTMSGHATMARAPAADVTALGRLLARFNTWRRNRRELRDLDDCQLNDAGLTRKQVQDACRLDLFG